MKKKSLVCFALISMVSANSFALELYKARVVSHKEWTTGEIKAVFQDVKNTHLSNQISKSHTDSSSFVASIAMPAKGTAGKLSELTGEHYVYVRNDTGSTQEYDYIFSICTVPGEHVSQCAYYDDTIQIDAGGYAISTMDPALQVVFKEAGTYPVFVEADLNANNTAGSVSMSSSTVDITK